MIKYYVSPVMVLSDNSAMGIVEVIKILEENSQEAIKDKGEIVEKKITINKMDKENGGYEGWEVYITYIIESNVPDVERELMHYMKLTERAMNLLEEVSGFCPILHREEIAELIKEHRG